MAKSLEYWSKRLDEMEKDLDHLDAASAGSRAPVELDQTRVGRLSRMDALQSQAMHAAISERRKHIKKRITAARNRITDEDFGFCMTCGEEIEDKRLELDPTTPLCPACAS